MKKGLLKLVALAIACSSMMAVAPIAAHADWKEEDGKTYYIDKQTGEKVAGYLGLGDKNGYHSYYFDEDGVLQKNTTVLGLYEVNEKGEFTEAAEKKIEEDPEEFDFRLTEAEREKDSTWKKENDKWTLYDKDGNQIKDKWYVKNAGWLHFDKDGYLDTSKTIDGYKVDRTGFLTEEEKATKDSSESYKENSILWKKENDDWYLYDNFGELVKEDWAKNNGVWYYFDKDGKMLKNTTIKDGGNNDCILNANGALTNREKPVVLVNRNEHTFKEENGEIHCYLDGKLSTGWVMHNDKWYYFDNNGDMQKDTTIIEDGKKYVLGDDGAWLN